MRIIQKKQYNPPTLNVKCKKIKVKGIDINGSNWKFLHNDSQIIMKFSQPVTGISYQCKIGNADFEAGSSVLYYREKKEAFSEIKTCRMPMIPNKTIERKIFFKKPVVEIRFDPVDFIGECEILNMHFEALDSSYNIQRALTEKIGHVDQGMLVFSNNLSETGGPILACHIAGELKKQGSNAVLISIKGGNGFLEKKLSDDKIPYILLSGDEKAESGFVCVGQDGFVMKPIEFSRIILAQLKKAGYITAIANTIVTAPYVELLKHYGYNVISLIHEMKTSIEFYGYREVGKKIADYADYIIFPNEIVKSDFLDLYPKQKGNCLVRPQGVYLRETKDSGADIELKVKKIYDDNSLFTEELVIMSSGTADLRKGVDLFVTSAIMLKKKYNFIGQFIWIGNFTDINVKAWLEDQICRAGCEGCIHFIPFIKDPKVYKRLVTSASIFWAMSREDPFPSTVLDAMKNRIPVIGFAGTGGIEVMLSGGKGILVEPFNLNDIVEASGKILAKQDEKMLMVAEEYADSLKFDEYVAYLLNIQDELLKRGKP